MASNPADAQDGRRRKCPRTQAPNLSQSTHHQVSMPLTSVVPAAVDAPMIAYVQRVSADNRRVFSDAIPVAPASPVKQARREAIQAYQQRRRDDQETLENERYQMQDLQDAPEEAEEAIVYDAAKPADPAMQQWLLAHRDTFLRALLWREGRRGVDPSCPGCDGARPAEVRCRDCYGGRMYCEECCAAAHRGSPLHCVEKWTGAYFARYTLRECGLRVQFGHVDGQRCPNPRRGRDDFVVMADNGIHDVAADFCGCYLTDDPDFVQVLRAGWFPSTTTSPRTAATLSCLESFQTLSLHGKTSAYDYYAALETLTNGAGIKPPDRYKVFLRVARQYRHIMMLKRGGRGHDRQGVLGTALGELAIRCPVCPRPDVNLPEGWQDATPEDRFLYTFFVALDACFRLKRRLISSLAKDPPSGPAWAYMTELVSYERFLASVTEQDDMSTCSGLAAVEQANTKFSRGYAVTGVGMGVCARHEFVLPNSVADLQRGERYANMDWVFFSLLQHICCLLWMVVSYDIVCQWTKKIMERVKNLEPMLRIRVIWALVRFVIPKLHILGHVAKCRSRYSLLLLRGGAQTDGEGIERPWSMIGGVAASTRASGPGSRADQLDDHWGFWNWRKTIGLPGLLRRRVDKANIELATQEEALAAFTREQAEFVPEWKRMIEEWEEDNDKPNPYEPTTSTGLSERAVREQFEQQEAEAEAAGARRIHDVGPTEFIVSLLDVEEEQRRIRALAELKRAGSTAMKINLRRSRKRLNKNIARLRAMQATYMPSALQELASLALPQDTLAEKVPLYPPSALTPVQRANGGCREGLVEIERQLRDAQCRSALVGLRNQLHVKYRLLLHKKQHLRHQGATTRSRAQIARNESKILLHSDKYQSARAALLRIAGERTGDTGGDAASAGEPAATRGEDVRGVAWPVLRKEDIRYLDDSDEGSWMPDDDEVFTVGGTDRTGRAGESRRVISWIWRVTGTAGTDAELRECSFLRRRRCFGTDRLAAIRIEWCKAYSRTCRWREEVRLLQEEWRRLPLSFKYEEGVWEARFDEVARMQLPDSDAEGLRAYAAKQADGFRDLARRAEVVRTQPKLRRGAKRPREWARIYRRSALDPRAVDSSDSSAQNGEGDVGVDMDGTPDEDEGDDYVEPDALDEHGNASDDDEVEEDGVL
ncbi:CxC2 domain-containing protein [Mycena kentingensis (nom. inval.)]|nr:CxC2 domain-containing protein [Mycena kentingensis (nom. inval.)]